LPGCTGENKFARVPAEMVYVTRVMKSIFPSDLSRISTVVLSLAAVC
jgi:hypothetical protein